VIASPLIAEVVHGSTYHMIIYLVGFSRVKFDYTRLG
jgi:hypothetical protein